MPKDFTDGFERNIDPRIDRNASRCDACYNYVRSMGPLTRTCRILDKVHEQHGNINDWLLWPQQPNKCGFFSAINGMAEESEMKKLKAGRIKLTPEERNEIMRRGATWHHGPNGEVTPAVWKSKVNGKIFYVCNTHRAYQAKKTLDAAIKAFEFIKTTA